MLNRNKLTKVSVARKESEGGLVHSLVKKGVVVSDGSGKESDGGGG